MLGYCCTLCAQQRATNLPSFLASANALCAPCRMSGGVAAAGRYGSERNAPKASSCVRDARLCLFRLLHRQVIFYILCSKVAHTHVKHAFLPVISAHS